MVDVNKELEGWKQRYYDTIGELEQREKQWGEIEQVLRQGLNRLSLAADDSDQELNRQLERLRGEIRKGIPSDLLKGQLSVISDSILRLDEARKAQARLPSPSELMLDLLSKIELPHGMGHRSRALQKKLVKAEGDEVLALVTEFSALMSEALQWAAAEEGAPPPVEEKPGLIGKLFSNKEKPGDKARLQQNSSEILDLAKELLDELIRSLVQDEVQSGALRDRLSASEHEQQLHRVARELVALLRAMGEKGLSDLSDEPVLVQEVLVRLLERLDIPAELSGELDAVKAMLLGEIAADEMDSVIVAIAELIAEMRSRMQSEKAEIENFLKQLTDRLQEIDSGFQLNVASQRESFREGKALDDAVTVQVQGIEESVQQAEELDALKQLVQQRVDTIRNHMQEFRSAEEQRLEQAEQQVAELTEKLDTVQKESSQLRHRLHEERNQAMIDPLTGIPNRLAYNERMKQEFARWRRYGSALSVAVWDVDKFKSVNDNYGHQAGDKVLTVIATLLQKKIRETDFVSRFGGEEFVLLMPETSAENAQIVVEQLRKTVEETEFHFRGTRVPITISCGLSEFATGDSPERVFEWADKALYQAKGNGRNQWCRG